MSPKKAAGPALPKDVREADLKYPKNYKTRIYGNDFDLWYCDQTGWVIPCLFISSAGRRRKPGMQDRHYAVAVDNGKLCSVGRGPHVRRTVSVYATKGNAKRLAPYFKLKLEGEVKANEYRDNLSSRRVAGRIRRRGLGF